MPTALPSLPRRLATLAGALLLATSAAQAQVTFVATRVALGAGGSTDWAALGSAFTTVGNPFTAATTVPGLNVTVGMPSSNFERRDQGTGWSGNFAPGDALLWTRGAAGPISLSFSSLIAGAGANIQADSYGAFTGSISAYDASNALLGSFTLPGNSTANGDGSAIFLGIQSAQQNIARVDFDLVRQGDLAINDVSIAAATTTTPEPGTYLLLTTGLAAIGVVARKRRTR